MSLFQSPFLRAVKMSSLGVDTVKILASMKVPIEGRQKPLEKTKIVRDVKPKTAKPKKESKKVKEVTIVQDNESSLIHNDATVAHDVVDTHETPVEAAKTPDEKSEEVESCTTVHENIPEKMIKEPKPRLSRKEQREKTEAIKEEVKKVMTEHNPDNKPLTELKQELTAELEEGRKKITIFKRHMSKMLETE